MKKDDDEGWVSGGLTTAFSYAVKGVAWYFGFFMLDSFMDFGLLHSDGFTQSPVATVAHEFMSPISNAMPEFFSEGIGANILSVLTDVLTGIHRLFGVTDTFPDGFGVFGDIGDGSEISKGVMSGAEGFGVPPADADAGISDLDLPF